MFKEIFHIKIINKNQRGAVALIIMFSLLIFGTGALIVQDAKLIQQAEKATMQKQEKPVLVSECDPNRIKIEDVR